MKVNIVIWITIRVIFLSLSRKVMSFLCLSICPNFYLFFLTLNLRSSCSDGGELLYFFNKSLSLKRPVLSESQPQCDLFGGSRNALKIGELCHPFPLLCIFATFSIIDLYSYDRTHHTQWYLAYLSRFLILVTFFYVLFGPFIYSSVLRLFYSIWSERLL